MLGLRPPVPLTVVGTDLLPEGSGGLAFWRSMATVPAMDIHLSFKSHLKISRSSISQQEHLRALTHAGDDAVHGELRGAVVEPPRGTALPLLLVEDEGGVLLLGDVDVVAGIGGGHDVARARIEQNTLVVLPLHADQTHPVPAQQQSYAQFPSRHSCEAHARTPRCKQNNRVKARLLITREVSRQHQEGNASSRTSTHFL